MNNVTKADSVMTTYLTWPIIVNGHDFLAQLQGVQFSLSLQVMSITSLLVCRYRYWLVREITYAANRMSLTLFIFELMGEICSFGKPLLFQLSALSKRWRRFIIKFFKYISVACIIFSKPLLPLLLENVALVSKNHILLALLVTQTRCIDRVTEFHYRVLPIDLELWNLGSTV